MRLLKGIFLQALSLAMLFVASSIARADDVTDWNQHMLRAGTVGGASPLVMSRVAAIVQASVFDAVNGIDRKYTPVHVTPAGPAGASRRAAAVEAAYTALVALFPPQKSTFDARLAVSLTAIASDPHESSAGIASGIAWGQTAANGILSWRATDGFTPPPPPFLGGSAVGQWRPTPPGFLPGAGPQFAYMTPWVISAPSQFRPDGPPALTSARYTADFNETKSMGSISSPIRTADQTIYAWFWAQSTATYLWNHLADTLIERGDRDDDHDSGRWAEGRDEHRNSLLEHARVLALLDLAMADAAIACWEAKYHYVAWRPVTAIPLADTDGNPATLPDPSWMPLFATPNHPEYPSGHSTVSGAAAVVLANFFGENSHFTMDNDLLIGVTRSYRSFTQALDEVKNARIFAGIHFRSACDDGQATGIQVANWVLENALLPAH
jgi:membrane-associated phospholipid phosphatase